MNFFNRMFSKQVKPAAKPESIARETERQPNVSDAECHFKPGHIVAGHLKVHKIAGTGGFELYMSSPTRIAVASVHLRRFIRDC